jgi:hypothetical protein
LSAVREVVTWPLVVQLRQQLADQILAAAEQRQAEEGWSDEETVSRVSSAACDLVSAVSESLDATVSMTLDVWEATRSEP